MTETTVSLTPVSTDVDKVQKAPDAYRTISEVAEELHIPQHRLRSWETLYPGVKPLRGESGRRYYSPDHIETLKLISDLLYVQGYKSQGVLRVLKERRVQKNNAVAEHRPGVSQEVQSDTPCLSAQNIEVRGEDAFIHAEHLAEARDRSHVIDAEIIESSSEFPARDSEIVCDDEIVFPEAPRDDVLKDVSEPVDLVVLKDSSESGSTEIVQCLRDENETLAYDLEKSRAENGYLRSELREILEELQSLRNLLPV